MTDIELSRLRVAILSIRADTGEGFALYDADATGELHAIIPTEWPVWRDPDYFLKAMSAHGASGAPFEALFAEPEVADD